MPTTPYEAYVRGRADRRAHPEATTWEGVLPYAVQDLVHSWIDGWRDEAGDYHWHVLVGKDTYQAIQVLWNCVGGRCPLCAHYPMTDMPDGILRCRTYPCRERNYPPVDRDKMALHLARLNEGAYI